MYENKKNWLILILIIGVMFGLGFWKASGYASFKRIYNLAKFRLDMEVDYAVLKSYDKGKYIFVTKKGAEKIVEDTRGVFVSTINPSGGYLKADWSLVKPRSNVQLAIKKTTGKIVAVLVL